MNKTDLPVFLSEITAKAQRYKAENPDSSDADLANAIVDDIDALSVNVFELAES